MMKENNSSRSMCTTVVLIRNSWVKPIIFVTGAPAGVVLGYSFTSYGAARALPTGKRTPAHSTSEGGIGR